MSFVARMAFREPITRLRAGRAATVRLLSNPRALMLLSFTLATATLASTVLSWRATAAWDASVRQLGERRASERLALLVAGLTQDMQGAQVRVLVPVTNEDLSFETPYDLADTFARAFARFPYAESFFVWRNTGLGDGVTHVFNRAERPPSWLAERPATPRFPVDILEGRRHLRAIIEHVRSRAATGQAFAMVNSEIAGYPYQVIVRLLYRGDHAGLFGIVGFTTDLQWVRRQYFPELIYQVGLVGGPPDTLELGILDEAGILVTANGGTAVSQQARRFPLLFMDPALLPRAQTPTAFWTARVAVPPEYSRTAGSGTRISIISLASLTLATLFLTIRAVSLNSKLAAMKSEFVSAVTHELKTPLAGIRLVADILAQGRYTSGNVIAEYATLLGQESTRLGRLIENLLTLARISDVRTFYSFATLNLSDLVNDAIDNEHARLHELDFRVSVDAPLEVPAVRGDRGALLHALDNLIDNAIRYSGAVRELTLRVGRHGRFVHLEVQDRGQGVPAGDEERVFDKFYRGRTSQRGGSGLGLTIVARIIADHGGTVSLRSHPGEGTCVRLELPMAEGSDDEPYPDR